MKTIVFSLSPSDPINYDKFYSSYRVDVKNATIKFALDIQGVHCTFYKSGKVVLQGKNSDTVFANFFSNYQDENSSQFTWPSQAQYVVGSDEVGTGDYFGGVVVCATRINETDALFLKELGITDSKKLTDHFIQKVTPQILERINYTIAAFNANQYNVFYQEYQNANFVKTYLHHQALTKIQQTGDYTVIDGFTTMNSWNDYLNKMHLPEIAIDQMIPKAEKLYYAVACASVIARYFFLQQIAEAEHQWKIKLALGGWNEKVKKAILLFLERYHSDQIPQVVKLHFRNLEKILLENTKE